MHKDLPFLRWFPKDHSGMYIAYDIYTFDNLFRLLLKSGMGHEDALFFVLARCSLSAIVFQERVHNRKYRSLTAEDALNPESAACRAQFVKDLLFG